MTLIQLFNKILPFVLPYKRMVFFALGFTLIGSFLAQVNAHILRYTVDSLESLLQNLNPLAEGYILLAQISAILVIKEIVNSIVIFGQKFYGEKLRIFIARDFSQKIVERILSYRMAFYTSQENESGKLQTRIDLGISSLTRLVQNFFIEVLPLFANSIVALFFMFSANFYVGLVSLCIIPIYFWISHIQASRLKGFRRKMRSYRETKNNGIIGLIESITVIKSFVRERLESNKHETIQFEMTSNQLATRKTSYFFDSIKSFLEQIGIVIIIILTAYFVLNGTMSLGAIMFHILLFNNVSAPIRQLHRIYDEVNDALIYSEGFFSILEEENAVESSGTFSPEIVEGEFRIANVNFIYPNGTFALENISFTVKPNQVTALVGLSGAGKSTLINLLDKFYKPSSGDIFLDGINLEEYDTNILRNSVGLVLQKNHIFKGTIRENISYGDPNAEDHEIILAAKKAYIHEQISELPDGYESQASLLSGGQQQRIAIARLFLKDPKIIFLDEPTASLDAIAIEEIKKSIDALKENRTVIVISHSISQIIDSDQIVVLDRGRIVEIGTHESLYKNKSAYYKIFSAMANSLNLEKITSAIDSK
ncbi:ABC transporter ATP-binding protein [Leptospira sp. GIMC2001]|uniref:ABC transporter ATP-binding protein n=1 Tax=Leptospira sp. GIMC2001 TaxID=1513297 RepID=UPI00234B7594|nr:ABC transporter ATP-binding protein [Leptospira sp. GIMC2001]WCL47771.1 ABC transporter ATP-binding protein [Leptospira sp. GIMC2001]